MPILPVINMQNKPVEQLSASDKVFAAEVKDHLFWEIVRSQMAKRRSGTASTKTRSEVAFSGAKLFRQKGTGRARAGNARSSIRVGGGTMFGPKPRDYSYNVPKKVRKAAIISALSMKASEGFLIVLDQIKLDEPKTKLFAAMCDNLGVKTALFVIEEKDEVLLRVSRNISSVKVLPVEGLNVYDILKYEHLVLTKEACKRIEERFGQ